MRDEKHSVAYKRAENVDKSDLVRTIDARVRKNAWCFIETAVYQVALFGDQSAYMVMPQARPTEFLAVHGADRRRI